MSEAMVNMLADCIGEEVRVHVRQRNQTTEVAWLTPIALDLGMNGPVLVARPRGARHASDVVRIEVRAVARVQRSEP